MNRTLTADDLPFVNLILAHDPALAQVVFSKLDAVRAALNPGQTSKTGHVPPTAGTPERIVDWLNANPGKHAPAEIRRALSLTDKDSGAFGALVVAKRVEHEGQGAGRRYWTKL